MPRLDLGPNMFMKNAQCTYNRTGTRHQEQEWATCYDCFSLQTEGACLSCLMKCHKGHNIGPIMYSSFFCDCGQNLCCRGKFPAPRYVFPADIFDKPEPTFGQGQSPFGQGQSPFGQGQSPFGQGQSPFGKAEPTFGQGQSPFGKANATFGKADPTFGKAQSTFLQPPRKSINWHLSTSGQEEYMVTPIMTGPIIDFGYMTAPIIDLGHGGSTDKIKTDIVSSNLLKFGESNNRFTDEILPHILSSKNKSDPYVFSPFSLKYASDAIYLSTANESKKELGQALFISDQDHAIIKSNLQEFCKLWQDKKNINVANGTFIRHDFKIKTKYIEFLNSIGLIDRLDANLINSFVANKTNNLIKQVVEEIDPNTVMMLVNTVYFKTNWKNKFSKSATMPKPFMKLSGVSSQVPMMSIETKMQYYDNQFIQSVEIPYADESFCFGMIMNRENSIPSFSYSGLDQIIKSQRVEEVQLSMPKFRQESQHNLVNPMRKLGVNKIFIDGQADFSNMSDRRDLYVGNIIQKAVIIVDEEGTEAAAATTYMVNCRSISISQPKVFKADHAFFYYIRHIPSNTLLFVGQYA